MTDTSSKQRDANKVFALGENALESGVLENDEANDVHDRMTDLNHRWNGLNIDVIEREKRLVKRYRFIYFFLEELFEFHAPDDKKFRPREIEE